jgi:hypothetical protein
VLQLDAKSRGRLAERLLDSLERLSAEENERMWAEEAQRRADAVESGALTTRDADDVFREARTNLIVRVTFNELAERELNDAAEYYKREPPGLGVAFLREERR